MPDLRSQLAGLLRGRVCLMGVGNIDYGDDGFGIRVAEALQARGVSDVVVAGNAPERYVGRVAEEGFRGLLFLDAVDFGAPPGSLVLLDSSQIAERFPQVSTHKISLGLLARSAESNGVTGAWLLGAQPESLQPAARLTATLEATRHALCELLCELLAGAAQGQAQ